MIKFYKFIFIAVWGLILVSCNSRQGYDNHEEIKVLNDVFVELIGTENYYKPLPNPPYPLTLEECENKEDSLRYLQWENEFNRLRQEPEEDSLDLVIAFSDTLISCHYEKEGISNLINQLKFDVSDSIIGAPYMPLMEFLIDSTKYQQRDNVLEKITQTGRYKLREVNQLRKDFPRYKNMVGFRFIGDVKLSRVVFNQERSHAVLYLEYICGAECGTGAVIWVKKSERKWKIVGGMNLWVS